MVIIYRKSAMMPIDGRAVGAISITNRSVKFFAKPPGIIVKESYLKLISYLCPAEPLGKNTCSAPYTADYQYIFPYNDLRLPLGIGSASGLEFRV